jgi:hypothetical protein
MLPIKAEKKVQQRIQNPAGVMRREPRRRFNGNHDQPENRGDPRLNKIVPVGVQSRALLNGIVGSLAGDHHIVYVALAKPGVANADEASFL